MEERKVLIISYVWPPMEGVGLVRAMKFAKYLGRHGWRPHILTVKCHEDVKIDERLEIDMGIKVHRTGYVDILGQLKRLLWTGIGTWPPVGQAGIKTVADSRSAGLGSIVREMVAIPDEQKGWYRFGVDEGLKVIRQEGIDLIFSTSPPETAHLIAGRLKRDSGLPWVADLRDLWADDHFRHRNAAKKMILMNMERRVLSGANAIVTVSSPWADTLRASLGVRVGDISVIENGFDEEDYMGKEYKGNPKLTIIYTGKLHRHHQDVGIFFEALGELIKEGRIDRKNIDVKFHLLGYDKPDIAGLSKAHGIDGVVRDCGSMSFDESAIAQRESDALLFIQWRGKGKDGWYSAKLYDYFGSRRPIIALAEKGGIIDSVISATSSGFVAYDKATLKDVMMKLYREHRNSGRVGYSGNESEIVKRSREKTAMQLASLFDTVTLRKERA